MPKRTDEHIVGDIAAGAVAQVFRECGSAVETIEQDYGEDLLVQSAHQGKVDPSRLWVQVKGTRDISRYRNPGGCYAMSVSTEHAFKWARSADAFTVILWDIEQGLGYSTFPPDQAENWNLAMLHRKTARLHFSLDTEELFPTGPFNHRNAKRLVWHARIHHYEGLLAHAILRDLEAESRGLQHQRSIVGLVAFDFLRLIGFWTGDEVAPASVEHYQQHLASNQHEARPEAEAALLAVARTVDEATDHLGISRTLLTHTSEIAHLILAGEGRAFWEPSSQPERQRSRIGVPRVK